MVEGSHVPGSVWPAVVVVCGGCMTGRLMTGILTRVWRGSCWVAVSAVVVGAGGRGARVVVGGGSWLGRGPGQDTYNVKKILSHRTYRKRLLFKVRWEGYTKDWDTEEPVETFLPSYNKVWRDYLQKQNLTQTVDILAHLGGPLS